MATNTVKRMGVAARPKRAKGERDVGGDFPPWRSWRLCVRQKSFAATKEWNLRESATPGQGAPLPKEIP